MKGTQWEVSESCSIHMVNNVVGIIDVNRLGQGGETMYGHNVKEYEKRVSAFGWETIVIDGHSLNQVVKAYEYADKVKGRPTMIIAKTLKGKGISFLENEEGWHGKTLDRNKYEEAIKELGEVDRFVRGELEEPKDEYPHIGESQQAEPLSYSTKPFANKKAEGH